MEEFQHDPDFVISEAEKIVRPLSIRHSIGQFLLTSLFLGGLGSGAMLINAEMLENFGKFPH